MFFIALAVVLTAVSVRMIRREPRRLSNGLGVIASLAAWLLGALIVLDRVEVRVEAMLIASATTVIFVAGVGLIGVCAINRAAVKRCQGFRLATVLPLASALVTVLSLGFLITVFLLLRPHAFPLWLLVSVWTAVLFAVGVAVQLAAFAVYTLIYGHIEPPRGSAAVIALGCRLGAGGSVTPLLASRLNRALEVYDAELRAGNRPALVVSGGQGVDGAVAEAPAMKMYLSARGVDDDRILTEASSRTTRENLVLSTKLLDSLDLNFGSMTIVTSDFHVLRTAGLSRDLGLNAHVTGARSAHFDAATACARECAAVLRRYLKANVALLLGIFVLVVLLQTVNCEVSSELIFRPWSERSALLPKDIATCTRRRENVPFSSLERCVGGS